MPLDTAAMARKVLAESDPDSAPLWQTDAGARATAVRLDIPLRLSSEALHILRWLARELPEICDRIERERDEGRRLFVAQVELQAVRQKVSRRRGR